MSQTITQGRLRINANFKRFVDEEVLPGTGLDAAAFWRNFDEIVHDLAPENRQLLAERDRIQAALDEWHRSNPGPVKDKAAYKSFLRELGYLVPQPERVTVETTGIDSEITSQAGPQLVVPAMNARYALNAANARWGSLYDALYGSDIIPQEGAMVSGYDPQRGEQVIAWVRRFLDESLPLENGSYQDVVAFKVVDKQLRIQLKNGKETTLRTPAQFVGYRGDAAAPTCILLKNNGLHIELQIDANGRIGKDDPAHINDVIVEAAISIGAMAGRQLPFLSVLVPFWLVAMMDGWKGVKETWPAALVAGGSFAVTQFFTSNYIGPELPDITSALVSIVSLALFLKVWRPKNTETAISMGQSAGAMVVNKPSSGGPVPSEYSLGQIIRAWSPFLILTVLVTIWTMKPFKALFAPGGAFYSLVINFQIPHLHQQVLKAAPIVAQPTPMDAVFKFDPLSAGGTAIFIAAIISIFILGVGIKKGIGVFAETLISLKWPILSIGMVLAFAFVTNYSGMSTTLALVLAGTGVMFPFFSPFLGWLGVFLTGSDTSSNALFGSLQSTTAQQINVSDTLLVAANTSGGVTGKMISPQSIAVACAATGMVGRESELFRYTVKHSLIFASVIGIITLLQAYVFTGMLVS
ncbi:TPA: hypothetical protein IRP18_002325 [Escherichia coli O25b:H4-ST131]|nr:hypothetical protein [Escherichia coli O25b:H4-ST131]